MKHECEASNFSQLSARVVCFDLLVSFVIGFLLRARLNVSEPSLDLFSLFFKRLRMRAPIPFKVLKINLCRNNCLTPGHLPKQFPYHEDTPFPSLVSVPHTNFPFS